MTHEELVERARGVARVFEAEAAESERLRRPTDAAMQAVVDAEIFKLMVPRRYGGFELDMDAFVDVVLVLAEADASLSWVTAFLIEHNWMLTLFPESFQKRFFAERSFVQAPAMIAPTGVAKAVPGGFELSGRWQWATGVWHSTWVIAGAIHVREEGGIDARFFALPREEVTVEDTWHVDGMCGTGSHDVVIDDRFVPEDQSVSIIEMNRGVAPGASIHDGPLYRTPMVPLLAATAAMPGLGQAKRLVAEYARRLPERKRMGAQDAQADSPIARSRLGRLSIEAHQTELLLRDSVRELCEKRDASVAADRVRLQAQIAMVVQQSRRIIEAVVSASGASAHRLSDPIQRAGRDAGVMATHVAFDLDSTLDNAGRALLGQDLPPIA